MVHQEVLFNLTVAGTHFTLTFSFSEKDLKVNILCKRKIKHIILKNILLILKKNESKSTSPSVMSDSL